MLGEDSNTQSQEEEKYFITTMHPAHLIYDSEKECHTTDQKPHSKSVTDECFNDINEKLIRLWEIRLLELKSEHAILATNDLDILNEELNLYNQRVIQNDCDRTRVKECQVIPTFRKDIESLLTYYCKQHNLKYRQGLNELMGPFLLLRYKITRSLAQVYNLFVCFIDYFLMNYYFENEFYSLQSSFSLLRILLKYHNPSLCNIFEYALITPEMYATSWMLTIFANKCKLDVVYHIWNILIHEKDQLFLHFFIIAFLQINQSQLVNIDFSQVPSMITQLTIKSTQDVDLIVSTARDIRNHTPFSFRLLANKLEIFHKKSTRLKDLYMNYDPDNFLAMPIFPSEIFHIAHTNLVNCPDSNCQNFKIYETHGTIYCDTEFQKEKASQSSCYHCSHPCNILDSSNGMTFVLLDLRISGNNPHDPKFDNRSGFLPLTVIINQDELCKEDFAEILSKRFIEEKEKYHFVLITSETDYFKEYENKFYQENTSSKSKKRTFGLQTRVSKEINIKMVKSYIKNDNSQKLSMRLKEFDNLKRSIVCFLRNNFPYVSYVYGGYREIHEMSVKCKIPLLNHDERCYMCKKSRKKTQKVGFFNLSDQEQSKKEKVNELEDSQKDIALEDSSSEAKLVTAITEKKSTSTGNIPETLFGTIDQLEREKAGKCLNRLSLDEITYLISDPNYIVYTCLLLEHQYLIGKSEKNPQIMLFITNTGIEIYKLERFLMTYHSKHKHISSSSSNLPNVSSSNNSNAEARRGSLAFVMIQSIQIEDITAITTKKHNKNVVTVQYKSKESSLSSMVIDFITDIDSRGFIKKTKQMIEALYNFK